MKFKEFYCKILSSSNKVVLENVPVDADYGTWGSTLRAGVEQRSQRETDNDTYLFKVLSDTLNISVSDAVNLVKQRLFEILFPNNTSNPANTENEYRQAIFDALTQVIEEIENENNTRIRGGGSLKTWTARIVSNLAVAQKTFGREQGQQRRIQPRQVRQAIEQASREVIQQPVEQQAPQLTDIQKLVKKTLLSGNTVPVVITDETREAIFGIRNIQEPDENKLLEYYLRCREFFQSSDPESRAKYTTVTSALLPMGPVRLRGCGRTNYTQKIIPDLNYFKFTYNFLLTKKVLPPSTVKLLQSLTQRYGIVFDKVYIYYSSSDRFVYRITGVTESRCNVLYSESVSASTKKQIPTNRKLTDGAAVIWIKYLQNYITNPEDRRLRYIADTLRELGITQ
jgi:hypothetical protein